MSRPKSDSLFHFTKNIDYLQSILLNGIYPRYCLEDISWFGIDEHVAYPIVSFCDIPLSRINEHTDFYGAYGIGFSKDWGLKNNLNPVIYCSEKGFVPRVAEYLLEKKDSETDDDKKQREVSFFKLIKLVKPLTGKILAGGSMVEKDFYQESEWRYTPIENIDDSVIWQAVFEKEKEKRNKEAEEYKLEFSPSDIKYIFVKNDNDIPIIVDWINNKLGEYPSNDLKILTSRIISLATIETDL